MSSSLFLFRLKWPDKKLSRARAAFLEHFKLFDIFAFILFLILSTAKYATYLHLDSFLMIFLDDPSRLLPSKENGPSQTKSPNTARLLFAAISILLPSFLTAYTIFNMVRQGDKKRFVADLGPQLSPIR